MTGAVRNLGLRARLLGLMALVVAPIVLASVLLASRAYRTNLASIETSRVQVVNDFAVRTRIWFRGASRTLLATATSAIHASTGDEACSRQLLETMRPNPGYLAMLAIRANGPPCAASVDADILPGDLISLAEIEQGKPPVQALAGPRFSPVRYDGWSKNGRVFLVIHVTLSGLEGASALLLADPQVIDSTFEIGPLDGAVVGLVSAQGQVLALRGLGNGQTDWLPAVVPAVTGYQSFEARTRGGQTAWFAAMPVADSSLTIVASFARDREQVAWQQYMVMALTPFAAGIFLFIAYAVALQRDVLRWILGIKRAARARINDSRSQTLAPISDEMPRELRSVATAFNAMVRDAQAREVVLTRSLSENRFLMRELHHRVKNSLQVIQSYLSLSQREAGRARRGDLAETEARVLVLSIAYRLALTEGGMRPVALRPLAEEVVANLTHSMRAEQQWVSLAIDVDTSLDVDRAIPFGLAIVESVIAALRSAPSGTVRIAIEDAGNGQTALRVSAAEAQGLKRPSPRIMQGLALQLQAQAGPTGEADVLNWTFAT